MPRNEKIARVSGGGALRRIEMKRTLSAPLLTVWDAITDPDKTLNWLGSGGLIEPWEGGRACLHNGPDCEPSANDLGQDGTVKVCQAPQIFEYTWNDRLESPGLVHFDLVELSPGATVLTLINFVPAEDVVGAAAGWHEITERLVDQLAQGSWVPVPAVEGRWQELCEIYGSPG